MVITYFGKSYFKITLGDLTIALNPPSKESKAFTKPPRFGSDLVLISSNHPDYNGVETVSIGDKQPFVIEGSGSYEIGGSFFNGESNRIFFDGKERINTLYGFEVDGIKICFMGIINDKASLSAEAKEIAALADIIFVPIGGGELFDPTMAYKVATSFDVNVIIPYEYNDQNIQKFLKEGGQEKVEILDKYTVKRRDLDGKEGVIIVLAPQA